MKSFHVFYTVNPMIELNSLDLTFPLYLPVLAPQDALAQLLQRGTVERQRTADQGVEDDAERPHVHLRPVVLAALEQLGRCVRWRAAECVQLRAGRELVREAKVRYLDVHLAVEQQVFRLQISKKRTDEGAYECELIEDESSS